MNVAEIYPKLISFVSDVNSETLRKHGFTSANITGYNDPLSHLPWKLQYKTEKLHQQTEFSISVGKPVRNVGNIQFCFVPEYTSVLWHLTNPK